MEQYPMNILLFMLADSSNCTLTNKANLTDGDHPLERAC